MDITPFSWENKNEKWSGTYICNRDDRISPSVPLSSCDLAASSEYNFHLLLFTSSKAVILLKMDQQWRFV